MLYLWQGADDYIHAKWAEAGYSTEISLFEDLQEAAVRFQEAACYRDYDSRQWDGECGCASNHHARHFYPHCDHSWSPRSSTSQQKPQDTSSKVKTASVNSSQSLSLSNNWANSSTKGDSKHQLSKKEMDELCAANKCFECKETGHLSHDCPRKKRLNKAGGSSLCSAAAGLQMTSTCTMDADTRGFLGVAAANTQESSPTIHSAELGHG